MNIFTRSGVAVAVLASATMTLSAQNIIWEQNFEDTLLIDATTNTLLDPFCEGCINWDLDGMTPANTQPQKYYYGSVAIDIDTTVVPWDTTSTMAAIAASWMEGFVGPQDNQLVLPLINITGTAAFSWDSKPAQGPRYQDGYSVYIMSSDSPIDMDDWDAGSATEVFNAAENENDPNAAADPATYDYSEGWMHDDYILTDAANPGNQFARMVNHVVDLSSYAGKYILIGFVHDSHDDNAIYLDNIVVAGAGSLNGVEENNAKFGLNSYPNPTNNIANVAFDLMNTSSVSATLYDITGKEIANQSSTMNAGKNVIQFKVDQLPAGLYNIKLMINNEIANTTILVK